MNLTEKLTDAQARFVECAEGIKAGDAETIAKAEGIKAEIDGIKADIAAAEKGAALLAAMGNDKPEPVKTAEPKTLGEFAAKNLDVMSIRGRKGASVATPEFKATNYLNRSVAEFVNSHEAASVEVKTPIRDAFGVERINGNTYSWVVFAGDNYGEFPQRILEGEQKPEINSPYTQKVEPLAKVAGWFKETDELVADNAYLASAIENRGVYKLAAVCESMLANQIYEYALNGVPVTGSGPEPASTIPSAGSWLIPVAEVSEGIDAVKLADYIYSAAAAVKQDTGADCDTVILSPDAALALRTGRDENGQYYGGGYFTGAYGAEGYMLMPNLWGMKVIIADIDGLAVVGNFRQGATVIEPINGGVRVEATNANEDDFIHDLVTIRLESRMLLAIREPGMFAAVGVDEG